MTLVTEAIGRSMSTSRPASTTSEVASYRTQASAVSAGMSGYDVEGGKPPGGGRRAAKATAATVNVDPRTIRFRGAVGYVL